jgi:hypothetical protein
VRAKHFFFCYSRGIILFALDFPRSKSHGSPVSLSVIDCVVQESACEN